MEHHSGTVEVSVEIGGSFFGMGASSEVKTAYTGGRQMTTVIGRIFTQKTNRSIRVIPFFVRYFQGGTVHKKRGARTKRN